VTQSASLQLLQELWWRSAGMRDRDLQARAGEFAIYEDLRQLALFMTGVTKVFAGRATESVPASSAVPTTSTQQQEHYQDN
jgi:hypothetical protein